MAFDPNLPTEHTLADAAQMRDQLNALKALIDQKTSQSAVTQLISENAACNCSTVDDFQMSVSDPPTREEVQSIVDVLSGLIAALKRPQ